VGSSTRIEGAKFSDAEVEKLLSRLQTKTFASRDEQEVAGYADAMDMIFEGYEAITSTENHIKQLHGVLLKYSAKDQDHRGHYKKVTNHVEAFGPDGESLGVVFETATPFETPGWMQDLVDWFNRSVEEESHHPLILIGIFVVVFLAIHPFKDGNGRLSRVVTTLLLLRAGYGYGPVLDPKSRPKASHAIRTDIGTAPLLAVRVEQISMWRHRLGVASTQPVRSSSAKQTPERVPA
jgi:Fic family protein